MKLISKHVEEVILTTPMHRWLCIRCARTWDWMERDGKRIPDRCCGDGAYLSQDARKLLDEGEIGTLCDTGLMQCSMKQ